MPENGRISQNSAQIHRITLFIPHDDVKYWCTGVKATGSYILSYGS